MVIKKVIFDKRFLRIFGPEGKKGERENYLISNFVIRNVCNVLCPSVKQKRNSGLDRLFVNVSRSHK